MGREGNGGGGGMRYGVVGNVKGNERIVTRIMSRGEGMSPVPSWCVMLVNTNTCMIGSGN